MEQLITPTMPSSEDEQLLLAVADGGYLVAAGDGVVRECGADLAELAGVAADGAVGRHMTALLQPEAPDALRAALTHALQGPGGEIEVAPQAGATRLRARVIPVPLALGWEFTALLSDLGSRDPEGWTTESLTAEHGRAVDALRAAAGHGAPAPDHDPTARLAGILVVVRPADGGHLDRADVGRRRNERAAAAAAAAAEALAAAMPGVDGPAGAGAEAPVPLDELVEQVRELRRRLADAEAAAAAGAAAQVDLTRERAALLAEAEEERAAREAAELATLEAQEALDELRAQVEAAREDAQNAAGLGDQVHALREELEETTARLRDTQAELDDTTVLLRDAEAELDAIRAERDAAVRSTLALAEEAGRSRSAASAIRTELAFDVPPPPARPAIPLPAEPGHAFAMIGPDGCFVRLDDGFCGLLGYREADLLKAGWPSIIDRDNAARHQEVARALRAGELEEAEVDTFYMHACGLLVGISGQVTAADEEGHLLLRVALPDATA